MRGRDTWILWGIGALLLLGIGMNASGLFAKLRLLMIRFENEKLNAYQDAAGLWTIGVGHLILPGDTVMRNGIPTHLHPYGPVTSITADESSAFLEHDTAIARNGVAQSVTVPLTDNQRAALISLAFNIGVGAFGSSTLLRLLNEGNYQSAADQFLVWNKAGGVVLPGLVSRRASERQLFLS